MKLSEKLKELEKKHDIAIDMNKYLVVRLDGRHFHTYTKKMGLDKPFDHAFLDSMSYTTRVLMEGVVQT